MRVKAKRNFLKKAFWLFDGEGDAGKGKTGSESTPPGNENPPADDKGKGGGESKPPEEKPDKDKAAREAAAAENKALKEKLAKYEAEEKKREDANKTEAEKRQAAEKELADTKRENLISRVRLDNGYTGKVFSHFTPKGDTEEEIKASFETFKTDLEESGYKHTTEKKPTPGQGGGTTPGKGSETKEKTEPTGILKRFFPADFGNSAQV